MVLQTVLSSNEITITENWDVVKIVGTKDKFEGVSEGDVIEYVPSWSEYKLSDLDRQMYDKGFRYKKILVLMNNEAIDLVNELFVTSIDTATPISEGKMREDCGDLRFYWWNGDSQAWEEISYWIDNDTVNSGETKVILRIPKVDANGYVNIVAYYGAKHYGRKDDLSIGFGVRAYEGKYLSFDGVDDYGVVGGGSNLNFSSITIAVRFRLADKTSDSTSIVFKYSSFQFSIDENDKLWWGIFGSALKSNIVLEVGKWYWAVITFDGSSNEAKWYVNGVLDVSDSLSKSIDSTSNVIYIGNKTDGGTYFRGDIAFVGIWDRVLDDDEIVSLKHGKVPNGAVVLLDGSDISGDYWTDSSGNGHNVTLYGNPKVYRIGKVLGFDGVDDKIDCGTVPEFKTSEPFSMVVMVRTTQLNSGQIVNRGMTHVAELQVNANGKVHFWVEDSSDADRYVFTQVPINDGSWHVIAGVYDGQYIKIYRDGNLDASLDISGFQIYYDENDCVYVGWGDTGHFDGDVAFVMLYNRALSDEEIQQIYENPNDPPRAGLVLWFAPDSVDDVNGVWEDKSGLGNDGTIYGAVLKEVRTFETTVQTSKVMGFDGEDDYVDVVDTSDLYFDKFTVAAIISPDNVDEFYTVVSKTGGNTPDTNLWLDVRDGGDIVFGFYDDGSNSHYVTVNDVVSVGETIFVAGVYDGTELRVFKNGSLIQSKAETAVPRNIDSSIKVGIRGSYGNRFDGKIYAVYIWNRALGDTEIQNLYNDPNNPPLDGLILWLDGTSIDETNGKWLNKAPALKSGYVEPLDGIIYGATPTVLLSSAWSEEIDMNSGGLRIIWRGKVVKKVESSNSTVLYVRVNNLGELINDAV